MRKAGLTMGACNTRVNSYIPHKSWYPIICELQFLRLHLTSQYKGVQPDREVQGMITAITIRLAAI
jgi:hypothetical protein